MARDSNIEWCEHTFNPWVGCQSVSPACAHCYAEVWAKRAGRDVFGPHAARQRTAPSTWAEPLKWNAEAVATKTRPFVFCASLADVFDNQVDPSWRADLFELIAACDELQWLLLTKRPQNIVRMVEKTKVSHPSRNISLGASIALPDEVERNASALIEAANALGSAFAFVSYEPALADIAAELRPWLTKPGHGGIEWVIAGGESGPNARPVHPEWLRHMRDVCGDTGARFLFKQWGEWLPVEAVEGPHKPLCAMTYDGRVAEGSTSPADPEDEAYWTTWIFEKVGKKAAGRLLDGRLWDERPRGR
jgi:protein gp37